MSDETGFRIPASLMWRVRLTTALAAALWLLVISIPLGGATAGLILLAIAVGGVGSVALYVLSVPVAIIHVVALIWWARTWLRLALASWGGIGAFVGAAVSLIFIPALIWGLSSLAYDAGVWPVGAVLRILAWVWFAAALVGVWRWVTRGSPES